MYGTYESITKRNAHGVLMRQCVCCGDTFPLLTNYNKNGTDEHGNPAYRQECKTCYNAKRKENRISNKHSQFVAHQRTRGEADVDYSFAEWRETVIYFGGACAYCGRTMRRNESLTRDHLLAVSKGGSTTQRNIVPACGACNSSKGNTDWREWLMKQPFFSQDRMNKIFAWRTMIAAANGDNVED